MCDKKKKKLQPELHVLRISQLQHFVTTSWITGVVPLYTLKWCFLAWTENLKDLDAKQNKKRNKGFSLGLCELVFSFLASFVFVFYLHESYLLHFCNNTGSRFCLFFVRIFYFQCMLLLSSCSIYLYVSQTTQILEKQTSCDTSCVGIINLTDRRFADLFFCSIRFNSLLRSTNTFYTFRCLQVFICRHVNYIYFPLLGLEIKILNKTFD